jgi:hypothetical protein
MIFSSKIQASAYKDKGYHENGSGAKGEGKKSRGNLHRSISQADLMMPRIKELHSS